MTWRLTVRYRHSTEVHDVPDTAALREAVMRYRADPQIENVTWLRLPDTPLRERCPRCGALYERPAVRDRICRCGLRHVTYRCLACWATDEDPPTHDGCGEIPPDQVGIADRYSRKRWRRVNSGYGDT
jgi:hypothetical protein